MRGVELARTAAVLAPRFDVLAVLGELEDAIVGASAMALRHEDIAVRRDVDVGRLIERIGRARVAGNAWLAQRHQYLAVLAEFDDGLALAALGHGVGYPYVTFTVHMEAMRVVDHAAAEFGLQIAVSIELHDRIER